jgi:alanine racemase
MTSADHCGAILSIDLDAVAANYRLLRDRVGGRSCAAVVKADGYGLGAARVAPALAAVGCKIFFVAQIEEGIALRGVLGEAEIHVLNGLMAGSEAVFVEHRLVPVLGSLGEIHAWKTYRAANPAAPAADVHVDTGMLRLGLPPDELAVLQAEPERLAGILVAYLISHLACADEPDHAMNRQQLDAFKAALSGLPPRAVSFANSSGIFLDPEYHFDLARPGVALYGVAPVAGEPNPMAQVVRLQGKIQQVRAVDSPQTVGYGATHRVTRKGRIATVPVGYADGYLRSLSNCGSGYIGDIRVPVVGRVSMDLITLDVSAVPEDQARPGTLVDLIGPHNPVDAVAGEAGTIGYEILTSLGQRYHRVYAGGGA